MNLFLTKMGNSLRYLFDPLRIIGMVLFCLFIFFLSVLGLTSGDLTIYSSSYLKIIFLIYTFLSIGFLIGMESIDSKDKLFFSLIGVNLSFFPLIVLSGQRECLPLLTPFIACIVQLFIVLSTQGLYAPFRRRNIFQGRNEDEGTLEDSSVINKGGLYNCILISGVTFPFTDFLLNKIGNQLKTVILIDQDILALAAMGSYLNKYYPKLEIVTSVIHRDNYGCSSSQESYQNEVESFFRVYKPDLIFDFDRFYSSEICLNSREGSRKSSPLNEGGDLEASEIFVHRNLRFPKYLIDAALKFQSLMVISLSIAPITSGKEEGASTQFLYETAQDWLECYAQHNDGAQTRVIPLRCYAPLEAPDSFNSLLGALWQKNKKDVLFASSDQNVEAIINLINQLLGNPAHHGGIWSLTQVVRVKRSQLQKYIKDCQMVSEIRKRVEDFLLKLIPEIIKEKTLIETSLFGVALVEECPLIEMDFEGTLSCFSKLIDQDKNRVA